jgi:hypothetical protein
MTGAAGAVLSYFRALSERTDFNHESVCQEYQYSARASNRYRPSATARAELTSSILFVKFENHVLF